MYIYIKTEPMLWTVGFYQPNGKFYPETDYPSPEEAAKRTAWFNGSKAENVNDTPKTWEENNREREERIIRYRVFLFIGLLCEGYMNFFKIVLMPPLFGAALGFPIIFILGQIGFFDGLSIWASAVTGCLAAMFGLIVGYYILYRIT